MRVEHGEVADDNWHRQGNGQDTGEGTEGSDKHARIGLGRHVAVAHCGHGHYGPPQTQGDAFELVVRIVLQKGTGYCFYYFNYFPAVTKLF